MLARDERQIHATRAAADLPKWHQLQRTDFQNWTAATRLLPNSWMSSSHHVVAFGILKISAGGHFAGQNAAAGSLTRRIWRLGTPSGSGNRNGVGEMCFVRLPPAIHPFHVIQFCCRNGQDARGRCDVKSPSHSRSNEVTKAASKQASKLRPAGDLRLPSQTDYLHNGNLGSRYVHY